MSGVKDRLLTALFPKCCALCGEVIAFDETLCPSCASTKPITGSICLKCGRERKRCECKKERFYAAYKGFCAPYYFRDSMSAAVYRLKSGDYPELAPPMAKEMAKTVRLRFEDVTFDCVTFVPMTRGRQRLRGYNQAALLANALADELGLPCVTLLKKKKHTRAQRTAGMQTRRSNLYNAYALNKSASVEGKTVLLVDDVKTTGTTLSECAKTLKVHGAKAVYATAFTVTDKKEK